MGKRRPPSNQIGLDFGQHQDRIILHAGQISAQHTGEALFQSLLQKEWLLEPPGEAADVSSAQDIIRQLGRRLHYPETVKVAQLHHIEADFVGFSALYQQRGWVFINARADEYDRCYLTHLLTASLGLYSSYEQPEVLAQRCEKLVFEVFLLERDVSSFFHKGISKFSPSLAMDISDFFRMPFNVILKRALQLEIITDEQFRSFTTVKPARPVKAKPLFVSKTGELEGDLENEPFWGSEDF